MKAHACVRALIHQPCPANTLLPFLYQTATIQRRSYQGHRRQPRYNEKRPSYNPDWPEPAPVNRRATTRDHDEYTTPFRPDSARRRQDDRSASNQSQLEQEAIDDEWADLIESMESVSAYKKRIASMKTDEEKKQDEEKKEAERTAWTMKQSREAAQEDNQALARLMEAAQKEPHSPDQVNRVEWPRDRHLVAGPRKNIPIEPISRKKKPQFSKVFPTGVNPQGTSITPNEFKVFQELLDMTKPQPWGDKPTQENEDEADAARTALAEKVSEAVGMDMKTPFHVEIRHKRAPLTDMEKKYQAEVNRVRSLMQDAPDDARLWQILQTEAISHVTALKLDAKEPRDPKEDEMRFQDKLKAVSHTFPRNLLTYQKLSRHARLKDSIYGVALLPYLKQLGPTTFALGATADLYNYHMRGLWRHYLDVEGLVSSLNDMHARGINGNPRTVEVLAKIIGSASDAVEAKPGLSKAQVAFFKTERMQQGMQQLKEWHQSLTRMIQDAHLSQDEDMDAELEEDDMLDTEMSEDEMAINEDEDVDAIPLAAA